MTLHKNPPAFGVSVEPGDSQVGIHDAGENIERKNFLSLWQNQVDREPDERGPLGENDPGVDEGDPRCPQFDRAAGQIQAK